MLNEIKAHRKFKNSFWHKAGTQVAIFMLIKLNSTSFLLLMGWGRDGYSCTYWLRENMEHFKDNAILSLSYAISGDLGLIWGSFLLVSYGAAIF